MTARPDLIIIDEVTWLAGDGSPLLAAKPRAGSSPAAAADLTRLFQGGITLSRRLEPGEPVPYWARPEYWDPLWLVREVAARHLPESGR